jgi:hypothetical protein
MDLMTFLQGSLNSIVKLIADSMHCFQNAYFSWKEGAETGVSPPPDEDVPNSARKVSWFMKCAGALWRPYYDSDGGTVYIPIYLQAEVGPFCLDCKEPVEWEGRTIFRPYFKWRCPRNHIHRIPKFFQKDLLMRAKKQILWELKTRDDTLKRGVVRDAQ